jgi:hypothetical protein
VTNKQSQHFVKAMFAERAAWFAVANRLPGSSNYDPVFWNEWVAAVQVLIAVPHQVDLEPA